jgi:diguanylate cyclase (GGDEF)-like protein
LLRSQWRHFITAGGRVEADDPDYLRLTAIHVIGVAAFLLVGIFFLSNLARIAQTGDWLRLGLNAYTLLVTGTAMVALRRQWRVETVARGINAALALFVVGLIYARPFGDMAVGIAAMYPPVAFLLLDHAGRAARWIATVTLVLVGMMLTGIHPWDERPVRFIEDVLTTVAIMTMITLTMAGYVHNRRHALNRLHKLRDELAEQSVRDPLTGLFNRRTFDEVLTRTLGLSARAQHAFGVLMLDVDHFKTYNDTHGHPCGDAVLCRIGEVLGSCFARDDDVSFRLGGEEFCVIFSAANRDNAQAMARHTLEAIENLDIPSPGGPRDHVTASAGLAWVEHGIGLQAARVYQAADRALYEAKLQGRARWTVNDVGPP